MFLLGSLVLGLLHISGGLESIENAVVPLTVHWLGLPKEAAGGFIMGVIRREFGTAGLFSFPMTDLQKLVALTTITLFVPCIASAMLIFKERGWLEGTLIWVGTIGTACLIGGTMNQLLLLFETILPGSSPLTMLAGTIFLALASILGLSRVNL